jgi:hypothetical protein
MKYFQILLFISLLFNNVQAQIWKDYLTSGNGRTIAIDAQNNIWFDNGCLLKFDGTNWTNYAPDGFMNLNMHAIVIDSNNNKWIATDENGVFKFDGTNWTNYNTSNSGLLDNTVYAIKIDAQNRIWFDTWSGLSEFDGTNWSNIGIYQNYNLGSLAIDKQNYKWIGTHTGVLKFLGSTVYANYQKSNSGLVNDTVTCINIDTKGNLWFGTAGGVSKFDGTNWTTYNTKNSGLSNNHIFCIIFDPNGNIWFGTAGGASEFDGTNWTNFNSTNSNLGNAKVISIAIDAQKNIWFNSMDHLWEYSKPFLIKSANELTLSDTANSTVTFTIHSNTVVSLTSSMSLYHHWLTVKESECTLSIPNICLKDSITFIATENKITKPRVDTLTLTLFDSWQGFSIPDSLGTVKLKSVYSTSDTFNVYFAPQTIIVTQAAGSAALSVSTNTLNIAAAANSQAYFNINSNTEWTVNSKYTWLTPSSTTGADSTSITLTASANPTNNQRIDTVIVSGNGVLSQKLIVTQAAGNATGIIDIVSTDVTLYPIPVTNNLTISFPNSPAQTTIAIYSSNGKEVYSSIVTKNITSVDMSKYPDGLYFVRIIFINNDIITRKIIKQ